MIPTLTDTILAVSTGWEASPLAILRLSGPESARLITRALLTDEPRTLQPCDAAESASRAPAMREVRLRIAEEFRLPATILQFHAPRSYTGQDVIEIHTVGNLPLLRMLCERLIAAGARRALPGEFTARAFINGKLSSEQVEDILALLSSGEQAAARAAARSARMEFEQRCERVREDLVALLALIEAGIDFVDEEDVRFVSPSQAAAQIDAALQTLEQLSHARRAARSGRPHVALLGLPNAGKSTLFNELLGSQRAIVSPIVGTTRDVLTAEIEICGAAIVLQDCAGLDDSPDALVAAAHQASELAADSAELVLWLHDAGAAWSAQERQALARFAPPQRLIVLTKCELRIAPPQPSSPTPDVCISVQQQHGLDALRAAIAARVSALASAPPRDVSELPRAAAALRRARLLAAGAHQTPELLALELREATEFLGRTESGPSSEEILGQIFARFCIGK